MNNIFSHLYILYIFDIHNILYKALRNILIKDRVPGTLPRIGSYIRKYEKRYFVCLFLFAKGSLYFRICALNRSLMLAF